MISTAYVDSLIPYPAIVAQDAEQLVLYSTYKYVPAVYKTLKQKTKIKYLPIVRVALIADLTEQSSRIPKDQRMPTANLIRKSQVPFLPTGHMMNRPLPSSLKSWMSILSSLHP
jgi:Ribophorin I